MPKLAGCSQWEGYAPSRLEAKSLVLMVAMMLTSLVPCCGATALAGVGCFSVSTVFEIAAFPLGVALAAVEMRQPALARAVPLAVGAVVLISGALQIIAWKTRHLARCRTEPGRGRSLPADAGTAWRHGVRLGLHCGCSSAV